jgi:microcystin-dependent protein
MGLEAATFIQDLDASNPLAGDRKNQGDDHLRLIKQVEKSTFPNATKAFYFPGSIALSADTSLGADYMNRAAMVDTGAGAKTLTLPSLGAGDAGWFCSVVKRSTSANPIFVVPAAGSILSIPSAGTSAFAKIRCDVPNKFHRFFWDGGGWLHDTDGPLSGSIETFAGGNLPVGFGTANGVSLLRADHPELFAAWGTNYGAADGSHFSAPDLRDKFLTFSGGSYALGATGGENTHTLITAEMPVHTHTISQTPHTHTVHSGETGTLHTGVDTLGGNSPALQGGLVTIDSANANVSNENAGSGAAHENRPPYFALMPIFRLC